MKTVSCLGHEPGWTSSRGPYPLRTASDHNRLPFRFDMATARRARPRMTLPWPLLLLLGAFALGITPSIASYGDNSPPFRACLAACLSRCSPSPDAVTTSSPALVLTHWTCSDECKYDCMTELTEGQLQHQFYGKWPFTRSVDLPSILF